MKVALSRKLLKEFIYEGIMDAQTTSITKEIVRVFLDVYFPKTPLDPDSLLPEKIITGQFPVPGFANPIEIEVDVTPMPDVDTIEAIEASWRAWKETPEGNRELNPVLGITVHIPEKASQLAKTQIPEFITSIKQFVRHELEHARQTFRSLSSGEKDVSGLKTHLGQSQFDQDNKFPDWDSSLENAYAYLTEPAEIEAHVMQAYKLAKHLKNPFIQSLNSLSGSYRDALGKKFGRVQAVVMMKKVKEIWLAYAKKRLPHLFNTSTP